MAIETELKLSLPASALGKLRRHPLLAGIKPEQQRLANTYYDTPDLALKQAKIALRHRTTAWGQLLTVKSAEPAAGGLARRSEWEAPSLPGAFDFSHVDNKPLRKRLTALMPQLLPVFTTDFLRTIWQLEPTAGVRIELAMDRGAVACAGRETPICEIELELLEGPTSALFDLALALQQDLPLHPEVESKAERGFKLFLDKAPEAARADKSPVNKEMSPDQAFRAVVFSCIEHLQRNERGARLGEAPEFVHQVRVAIRRLRSAMHLWAPLLPTDFVRQHEADWQQLAHTLGELRNRDLFATQILPPLLSVFPKEKGLQQLALSVDRQREQLRRKVRSTLNDPLLDQRMLRFTADLIAMPESVSLESMADFARRRLRNLVRKVHIKALATHNDPEAHHQLRIALKRLRYSLEFMAPLYPRKAVRCYLDAVSDLLELLGSMNDIVVAQQYIASQRSKPDPLLSGWLAGQGALLHELLPAALDDFRQVHPPWKKLR